jgi:2-polyprenyl-3-methyl-5-hydroxy-6-metoxy-1,4-benzoquinol methylase
MSEVYTYMYIYIDMNHEYISKFVYTYVNELLYLQEVNYQNSVCDAGCGVGSLAIPMAQMFSKVSASDISSSMTNEVHIYIYSYIYINTPAFMYLQYVCI